jgi:hypothetical protein
MASSGLVALRKAVKKGRLPCERKKRPCFGGRFCVRTEPASVTTFLSNGCGLARRFPVNRFRVATLPLGRAAAFGFDASIPSLFSGRNDFRNGKWNNHSRTFLTSAFLS